MALDAKKFKEEIEEKDVVFIDVRSKEEFDSIRIPNSKNIPLDVIPFNNELLSMNPNSKIRLYCLSGGRSLNAKNFLIQKGFKDVDDLRGGIMSWPFETEK